MKKIITLLVFVFCLLYMESCSQTKASIDAFFNSENSSSTAKENSSEDGCPKKNYDECEALFEAEYAAFEAEYASSVSQFGSCHSVMRNRLNEIERKQQFSEIESIEKEFSACSNFYEKCECWANTKLKQNAVGLARKASYMRGSAEEFRSDKRAFLEYEPSVKDKIAQLRKQETQKREQEESERRAQAIRDSVANEIQVLIKEGTEASLILNKCSEHLEAFRYYSPECRQIQDSIKRQQYITESTAEITALLKANKLEECLDKCEVTTRVVDSDEKIADLCKKQLVNKIKKLPKKSITSTLAKVYFENHKQVGGYVIQNDGKMLLMEDFVGTIMMIQHTGHIGECRLGPNRKIPFIGNVKYLGEKTYTTVLGVRQTVSNYQLLWCD